MLTRGTQHKSNASDDATLVRAAREGDLSAFDELVRRHTMMVFRVAMHITVSQADAEEVLQDAFVKAFQHLHGFEERSQFSTWLRRIAVNEALIKIRKLRGATMLSLDEEPDDSVAIREQIADWRPNPEQLFSQNELRRILQSAMMSLPYGYRIVFLLRDVEGLSITETADALGLSISNVKTRLLRARLKLRERLSPYFVPHMSTSRSSVPLRHMANTLRAAAVAV